MQGSNRRSLQWDMTDDSAICASGYETKRMRCQSETDNSEKQGIKSRDQNVHYTTQDQTLHYRTEKPIISPSRTDANSIISPDRTDTVYYQSGSNRTLFRCLPLPNPMFPLGPASSSTGVTKHHTGCTGHPQWSPTAPAALARNIGRQIQTRIAYLHSSLPQARHCSRAVLMVGQCGLQRRWVLASKRRCGQCGRRGRLLMCDCHQSYSRIRSRGRY